MTGWKQKGGEKSGRCEFVYMSLMYDEQNRLAAKSFGGRE